MDLNNPAQQRRVGDILASLPKAARSLAILDRAVEQQRQFDAAVAAALDRILMNAPAEALRPLAKQLRKRIKEIAANA